MYSLRYSRYAALLCAAVFSLLVSCSPSKKYLIEQGQQAIGRESAYIKVLVLRSQENVSIAARGKIRVSNLKSRSIDYERTDSKIVFSADKVLSPVIVESSSNWIEVNGVRYRGMAELHNIVGAICVINVVRLDDYLMAVVPSEMAASWPAEALKAQAVAARTYAYYHILKKKGDVYDLDATTNFQVYRGVSAETAASTKAVTDTAGQIMIFGNKPVLAFFHSTCGGSTIDGRYVWSGEDLPYLRGVSCGFCADSPYYRWEERMSMPELRQFIAGRYAGIGQIRGISFDRLHGRVVEATIRHRNGTIKISGNDFRQIFPEKRIKSMCFVAAKKGKNFQIEGRGWGHGVGMCQYGAKGMADRGAPYKKILQYYYRGVSIDTISK
jgi:stage II sporulation protein D